jgi:hypothetical protein
MAEDLVSTAPADWEWNIVAEESPTRVIFDKIDDVFIGQYKGMTHVDQPVNAKGEDQSFDLWTFRGRDGVLYAINDSYKMREAMDNGAVVIGDWCRITFVKEIPTTKGNPVKDLRIEVRKPLAAS